jgi:hypothetical protein
MSSPVVYAVETANLTLLLALGIALAWRHRDRPLVTGILVALVISLKPFVWPVGLWLLATRRWRAAGWAVVAGLAANAGAWAILGFGALHQYLHLASQVTTALDARGYGVIAMAGYVGIGQSAGLALEAALSLALAAACVRSGRRGRELEALTFATLLMLSASPLVWTHYTAMLLVPLAIARPRLSIGWIATLAMWPCPALHVTGWQAAIVWLIVGVIAIDALRARTPSWRYRPLVAGPAAAHSSA